MGKVQMLTYSSAIKDLVEVNESFSSCKLSICYTGLNRNGSSISKEAIERAIPTIYNCPIVANYDVYSNVIGGHDVEVITDDAGDVKLVNLTSAIGVVPTGANVFWETKVDNGVEHEYLCAEAILWKRSPAYQKVAEDGVTNQSMEISVNEGTLKEGVFDIAAFEFNAFCLLGSDKEPCFESANLTMGSSLMYELSEMLADFKTFAMKVQPSVSEVDICTNDTEMKGGEETLDNETKNVEPEEVVDEPVVNEPEVADKPAEEVVDEPAADEPAAEETEAEEPAEPAEDAGDGDADPPAANFELNSNFAEVLYKAVGHGPTFENRWNETWPLYRFVDFDSSASMVYVMNEQDYNLYGMSYTLNGDNVVIDFTNPMRKKYAIVDFNEGDAESGVATAFSKIVEAFVAHEDKVNEEVATLREFKLQTEAEKLAAMRENIFQAFSDLAGNEAFEALKSDPGDMSPEAVEEKCFAIRGRMHTPTKANFEAKKPTKLPFMQNDTITEVVDHKDEEPYGGLFKKYLRQ